MEIKTRSAERHSKPQTSMMITLRLQQKTKQKSAAQFARQGGGGVILFTFIVLYEFFNNWALDVLTCVRPRAGFARSNACGDGGSGRIGASLCGETTGDEAGNKNWYIDSFMLMKESMY